MTVKQLIVGSILGVTAVATLVHRLPKHSLQDLKTPAKQTAQAKHKAKRDARLSRTPLHKQVPDSRMTLSKTFE